MAAGLARSRRLHLGRLAISQGAVLALGRLLATGLLGGGRGFGSFALAGGLGLLEPQPLGLRGHLPVPLQERRQLVPLEGQLARLMGRLMAELIEGGHRGGEDALGFPQRQSLLLQRVLEGGHLALLLGDGRGARLDGGDQALRGLTQGGQGRLRLRRASVGVLDLLGEIPEFRLVPVDVAADAEERLLGGSHGLLFAQGLQAALFQGGLGRADPGPDAGQRSAARVPSARAASGAPPTAPRAP